MQASTFDQHSANNEEISLKHVQWMIQINSLTELMVSQDLLHSAVTNQVTFDHSRFSFDL